MNDTETTENTKPQGRGVRRRGFLGLTAAAVAAAAIHSLPGWVGTRPKEHPLIPSIEEEPQPRAIDPVDALDEAMRRGEPFAKEAIESCRFLMTHDYPTARNYPVHGTCLGEGSLADSIINVRENKLNQEKIIRENDEKGQVYVTLSTHAPVPKRGFLRRHFERTHDAITGYLTRKKEYPPIGFEVLRVVDRTEIDPDHEVSKFLDLWQMGLAAERLGLNEEQEHEESNTPLVHNTQEDGHKWLCVEQVGVFVQLRPDGVMGSYNRILFLEKGNDKIQILVTSDSRQTPDANYHQGHQVSVFFGGNMDADKSNLLVGHLIGLMRSTGFRDGSSSFGKSTQRNLALDPEEPFPAA